MLNFESVGDRYMASFRAGLIERIEDEWQACFDAFVAGVATSPSARDLVEQAVIVIAEQYGVDELALLPRIDAWADMLHDEQSQGNQGTNLLIETILAAI